MPFEPFFAFNAACTTELASGVYSNPDGSLFATVKFANGDAFGSDDTPVLPLDDYPRHSAVGN